MRKVFWIPAVICLLVASIALPVLSARVRVLKAPGQGYTAYSLIFPLGWGRDFVAVLWAGSRGDPDIVEVRDWPSLRLRGSIKVGEFFFLPATPFYAQGGEIAFPISPGFIVRISSQGVLLGAIPIPQNPFKVWALSYAQDGTIWALVERDEETSLEHYSPEGQLLSSMVLIPNELSYWGTHSFSAGGRFFAYMKDLFTVELLDLVTGERREWNIKPLILASTGDERRVVVGVAVHPQGREIALGFLIKSEDGSCPLVVRLDTESGEAIEEFLPSRESYDECLTLLYSPDGSYLVVCPRSGGIYLKRTEDDELITLCGWDEYRKCGSEPVAFSADGRYLGALSRDKIFFLEIPGR